MSAVDTTRIDLLEHFLDLTSSRHGLIAGNISNIDTPGYRTRDMDFKAEVMKLVKSPEQTPGPVVREVRNLMERPDGNNVSLDREGLLLAQTQLQYRMGIQLVKEEIHRIEMAINDGK
jgi:flagellar basal-body rod protein FlgB